MNISKSSYIIVMIMLFSLLPRYIYSDSCVYNTMRDGNDVICIEYCPHLEIFAAQIIQEALVHDSGYFSDTLLQFCENILDQKREFCPQEIQPIVSELLAVLSKKIEQAKAPRPDAPGNTDGAPVGSLLECDLTQVVQLVRQLTNIVNQCCAEIQIDFNGVFTVLAELEIDITSTSLAEILNTLTACCAEIQADFNGVFTAINDVSTTLTNCCEAIEINFDGTFTALADLGNGTFTVLADISNDAATCCNATLTTLAALSTTLTACCADIAVNFSGTFTVMQEILDVLATCCPLAARGLRNEQDTICLEDANLKIFVTQLLKQSMNDDTYNDFSGTLLIFFGKILTDNYEFSLDEIRIVIPELVSLLVEKMKQNKKPRITLHPSMMQSAILHALSTSRIVYS